jgi:hypothetical protein
MKMKTILLGLGVALLAELASAQTTAFNFTGQLSDGGSPANGNYDFNFRIYSVSSGGSEVAPAISAPSTPVRNGVFSSMLDYGANVFTNGGNLWVQAEVRTAGTSGAYAPLGRQQLTPVPFALYALKGVPGPQGPAGAPGVAGAPGPQGPPGTGDAAGLTNYAQLNVPDTAAQAGAVPTVAGGFIVGVTVTSQGNGYVTNPIVNVTDATGSGAVLTPIVVGSKIVGITVSNPGSGYSANPIISISAPPKYTRQTFTGDNQFTGNNAITGQFTGDGGGLTNLFDWVAVSNCVMVFPTLVLPLANFNAGVDVVAQVNLPIGARLKGLSHQFRVKMPDPKSSVAYVCQTVELGCSSPTGKTIVATSSPPWYQEVSNAFQTISMHKSIENVNVESGQSYWVHFVLDQGNGWGERYDIDYIAVEYVTPILKHTR